MPSGNVDRSQVKHLAQHELDTADRLAKLGFDVVFRLPKGRHTSDAYVNGVRTELKWSSSVKPRNIKRQVSRRRRQQGPQYVLDVSDSGLPFDRVVALTRELCDAFADREIATIMVIAEQSDHGSVRMHIVGQEVAPWLT